MADYKTEERVILLKKFDQGKDISQLAELLEKRNFYVGSTKFRDAASIKSEIRFHNADSRGHVKLFRNGEFAEVRLYAGSPEILGSSVKFLDPDEITAKEINWLLSLS